MLIATSAVEPEVRIDAVPVPGAPPELALRQRLELCRAIAASDLGGRSYYLALPFDVPDSVARPLLREPAVAGLLLRRPPDALRRDHPDAIGRWVGARMTEWALPRRPARHVVFCGRQAQIGPRILLACLKHGVRTILFVDPWSMHGDHRGTLALLPIVILEKAAERLPRLASKAFLRPLHVDGSALRRTSDRLWRAINPLDQRLRHLVRASAASRLPAGAFVPERVLYAIGTLGPGGAERQLVNTVLGVQRYGRMPMVVCTDLTAPRARFFFDRLHAHGVPVVTLREFMPATIGAGTADALRQLRPELQKLPADLAEAVMGFVVIMRDVRPGVVHAFLDDTNIQAGLAAVLTGVPRIVLGARSMAPTNFALFKPSMAPCYQVLLEQPNVVLLNNSRAGAENYCAWLKRPRQRIEVLYNGLDLERAAAEVAPSNLRQQLSLTADALVIGTAMRMTEEKGPLLWAEAALQIARRLPKAAFVIAGDGPLLGRLNAILASGGITDRVHCIGHTNDMAALMASLDLFLLTSRMEGLPNVLIEAQAYGVPVVTTPAGGAVETLDPGRTGLIAPDWTVGSVVASCLKLLEDDALRARCAARAPEFVGARFGLGRMIDETLAVYQGRFDALLPNRAQTCSTMGHHD